MLNFSFSRIQPPIFAQPTCQNLTTCCSMVLKTFKKMTTSRVRLYIFFPLLQQYLIAAEFKVQFVTNLFYFMLVVESECVDRFSGAGVPKFSLQKREMTHVFPRSDRKYAPLWRTSAVLLAVGGSSRERRLTRSAHTANRRVFFSLRSTETPARRRQ